MAKAPMLPESESYWEDKMTSKREKWWLNGVAGALLFGSGLSLSIESGFWKHSSEPWYYWVLGGTAGIGLALSGVVLLIRAGILKWEMDQEGN